MKTMFNSCLRAVALVALGLFFVLASGCRGQGETGPVEIKFDRDGCARCSMIISDRNFPVEVRGGPDKKVYKFDDLGCAMHWLEGKEWASDQSTEIWVTDMKTMTWLEAKKSRFVGGKTTPMAYGFGATSEASPETVSFEEARRAVMSRK
jgi:nitrous oxide reductase accessory protein NosL